MASRLNILGSLISAGTSIAIAKNVYERSEKGQTAKQKQEYQQQKADLEATRQELQAAIASGDVTQRGVKDLKMRLAENYDKEAALAKKYGNLTDYIRAKGYGRTQESVAARKAQLIKRKKPYEDVKSLPIDGGKTVGDLGLTNAQLAEIRKQLKGGKR